MTIATYANDTVVLTSHTDLTVASEDLQQHFDKIQIRQHMWRIAVNESHVSFALICKSVTRSP